MQYRMFANSIQGEYFIMTIEHTNPPTLFDASQFGFTQVVSTTGGKTVHISGQVACDENVQLVGPGDLAAQIEKALDNVRRAIEAVGGTIDDIVYTRDFIVNYKPEYFEIINKARNDFFGDRKPPANTLLGVQSLALPELLIEIEATAVIAA